MDKSKAAATVEDYMAGLEPIVRNTLEKVRKAIRQAAKPPKKTKAAK